MISALKSKDNSIRQFSLLDRLAVKGCLGYNVDSNLASLIFDFDDILIAKDSSITSFSIFSDNLIVFLIEEADSLILDSFNYRNSGS